MRFATALGNRIFIPVWAFATCDKTFSVPGGNKFAEGSVTASRWFSDHDIFHVHNPLMFLHAFNELG